MRILFFVFFLVFFNFEAAAQADRIETLHTLKFKESGGQDRISVIPPALSASYTLTLPTDDGTSGQVLSTNGSGVLSWVANGAGDVAGPGSATDNAVARFDGTTGKLIQNSGLIVSDSNDLTGVRLLGVSEQINLEETGAGTDNINIQAPASIAAAYTLTLPVDDGTANQFMKTDGSGVLSWSSANLATDVGASILPLANGGTNKNMTPVAGGVVFTDSDSQEVTGAGTSGMVLESNGTSGPSFGWGTQIVFAGHFTGGNSVTTTSTSLTTIADTNIPAPTILYNHATLCNASTADLNAIQITCQNTQPGIYTVVFGALSWMRGDTNGFTATIGCSDGATTWETAVARNGNTDDIFPISSHSCSYYYSSGTGSRTFTAMYRTESGGTARVAWNTNRITILYSPL